MNAGLAVTKITAGVAKRNTRCVYCHEPIKNGEGLEWVVRKGSWKGSPHHKTCTDDMIIDTDSLEDWTFDDAYMGVG